MIFCRSARGELRGLRLAFGSSGVCGDATGAQRTLFRLPGGLIGTSCILFLAAQKWSFRCKGAFRASMSISLVVLLAATLAGPALAQTALVSVSVSLRTKKGERQLNQKIWPPDHLSNRE